MLKLQIMGAILKQKYWVCKVFKHSLKTQGEKLNNSSKKLKVSANLLGLLAESRSNKKPGLERPTAISMHFLLSNWFLPLGCAAEMQKPTI